MALRYRFAGTGTKLPYAAIVKAEDVVSGLIVCKGNVSAYETYDKKWWGSYYVGDRFHFTMQFDIKEERARVRIFDIHTSNISAYSETTEKSLESIMFEKTRSTNKATGKNKERR